jgi:hypothetical protein
MTNSVVSRVGQINTAGATDALFLKQFGGEILTEFERSTVFKSRHFVRQIKNGKTAQFPSIGTVTSSYHTPGNFIDGQTVKHAETLISVDGLLLAPVFIDKVDELMNHYDVRGPYATEMGRELAQQFDINVARMAVLAARASNNLTGRSGGSQLTSTNMDTVQAELRAAMFSAAQTLDEKNVGVANCNAFFRPAQYYLMAQDTTLINKDYNGAGSIAAGSIETVAGFPIVKTNNVPKTNVTGTVGNKYNGDFSKTVGIIMNKWAVGTVQLMDISLESEWEIRRQGTFMVAKMAVGHGILRPECSIELAYTHA